MKPMDHYKAAVMHRVEEKRAARKRAVRRTLAVCLPLCLCLSLVGAVALPRLMTIGEDHAPELNDGALTTGHPGATVLHGNTVVAVINDADAVYNAISALYTINESASEELTGGTGEITDGGEDAESYYDSLGDNGTLQESTPYYLSFPHSDGTHVFMLQDGMLTDLISGDSVYLTEEQATALMNGETP